VTAVELVAAARGVLVVDDPSTRGLWSRIATHLARQALERAVAEYWDQRSRGLSSANMRTQLICLRGWREDTAVCRRLAFVWSALSEASHGRGGPPSRADLEAWIEAVEAFLAGSR